MKIADLEDKGREAPSPLEIRHQLTLILESRTFRAAEGQKAFLRYIVEETLVHGGQQIKEYMVGVEALGRGEAFDPRIDPIVRTQARKLRAHLTKYYEGEGLQDAIRIELPKGSYVPVFHFAAEAPVAPKPSPVPAPAIAKRPGPLVLALALMTLTLAVLLSSPSGGLHDNGRSVVVMPFANVLQDQTGEFLADGLTEELIASLGQLPGVRVVARASAFQFKGQNLDRKEIARRLHVGSILEGSVRKSEGRISVTAQLVSAADGALVWSSHYDRESDDLRSIGRDISQAMANALSVPRSTARPYFSASSPRPGAYQDYLRGMHFWNKLSVENLETAIQYFQSAIAEDPSFARAYSALADSYVMAPQVATAPSPEIVAKIRRAANKALELDGGLGEAHFDLAICAEYDFDWDTAEREFQKGLELSPNNAVAHLWYAKLLGHRGKIPEVLTHRRIAATLDPVSPYAAQSMGGYYSVVGNYDEAIRYFHLALELEPGFGLARQGLGIAYMLQNRPEDAIRELKLAGQLMKGPRRLALLGYAYGMLKRTEDAQKVLRELQTIAKHQPVPALSFAQVYIGMGDKDRAFEWMEKAILERDLGLVLQWDSLYQPLRSDPRYIGLLRRMKLA